MDQELGILGFLFMFVAYLIVLLVCATTFTNPWFFLAVVLAGFFGLMIYLLIVITGG